MYYDPEIDHAQALSNNLIGLGVAFYIVPYNGELAYSLYRCAVEQLGLYADEYKIEAWAKAYGSGLVFFQLALVLAIEFNEVPVAERVRGVLETVAEPKDFDGGSFGFFYNFGESWPRGQLSALLMVAEVIEPGAWRRVFHNVSYKDRFTAPTVEGVDFPAMGLSQAWNDSDAGTLTISTHSSLTPTPTTFKITNLRSNPDSPAESISITRNGWEFSDWEWVDEATVDVRCLMENQTFVVHTGYHGPTGIGSGFQDSRL